MMHSIHSAFHTAVCRGAHKPEDCLPDLHQITGLLPGHPLSVTVRGICSHLDVARPDELCGSLQAQQTGQTLEGRLATWGCAIMHNSYVP